MQQRLFRLQSQRYWLPSSLLGVFSWGDVKKHPFTNMEKITTKGFHPSPAESISSSGYWQIKNDHQEIPWTTTGSYTYHEESRPLDNSQQHHSRVLDNLREAILPHSFSLSVMCLLYNLGAGHFWGLRAEHHKPPYSIYGGMKWAAFT